MLAVGDAEHEDDLAHGDELPDHPRQLEDLVVVEPLPELGEEGVVDLMVVEVHLVGVAKRHLFAFGEGSPLIVGERGDDVLGDPLVPSRGQARGRSVVAPVQLGQPEADELLRSELDESFAHQRPVELHEAL